MLGDLKTDRRAHLQDAVVEDKGKASKEEIEAARGSEVEMYIGFDKADTEPRKGRKGRLVKGNPEDYPDRTDFTGGWAGGEKGLQEFIRQYEVGSKIAALLVSYIHFHWNRLRVKFILPLNTLCLLLLRANMLPMQRL